jgi:hypothetical protein
LLFLSNAGAPKKSQTCSTQLSHKKKSLPLTLWWNPKPVSVDWKLLRYNSPRLSAIKRVLHAPELDVKDNGWL